VPNLLLAPTYWWPGPRGDERPQLTGGLVQFLFTGGNLRHVFEWSSIKRKKALSVTFSKIARMCAPWTVPATERGGEKTGGGIAGQVRGEGVAGGANECARVWNSAGIYTYIYIYIYILGGNQPLHANYGNFNLNHTMLIQRGAQRRWEEWFAKSPLQITPPTSHEFCKSPLTPLMS
jgi:hypothetical protein